MDTRIQSDRPSHPADNCTQLKHEPAQFLSLLVKSSQVLPFRYSTGVRVGIAYDRGTKRVSSSRSVGGRGAGVRMTVTIARDVLEHRALVSRHLESASGRIHRPRPHVFPRRDSGVRPFTEISPRRKGRRGERG